MSFFEVGLRRALAQVPRAPLGCRQCLHQQSSQPLLAMLPRNAAKSASTTKLFAPSSRRAFRTSVPMRSASVKTTKTTAPSRPMTTAVPLPGSIASVASAASAASSTASATKSSFPDTSSKAVGYWLVASAASVFGIVVFGGLTRLTESGLSITEWKPVTGAMPPRSAEDWEAEFAKYRESPEYARLNPNMNVEEFKKIYFMEWFHRVWGRFIGMSFVIPAVYFVARRRVTKRMAWHLFGIAGMIGLQGAIGWWMVSSGLRDELFDKDADPPRVSQYRLTTHLSTAIVCYSWMLLAGLSVFRDIRFRANPAAGAQLAKTLKLPVLKPFRSVTAALIALVFVTAMSGGLVAGLDAGLIYNEFPKMGVGLTPPREELWDAHYSQNPDRSDLWWRNMLENPSLVQLNHRILATTTFCSVLALFAYARTGRIAAVLPRDAMKGTTGAVHLVLMQATLGICTLIYMVPVHLAATHQAGALALLTGVLVLGHRLHIPKSSLRLIEKYLAQVPKSNIKPRVATKS